MVTCIMGAPVFVDRIAITNISWHFQAVVAGFTPHVMPKVDLRTLGEMFRASVLKMLQKEGLIDRPPAYIWLLAAIERLEKYLFQPAHLCLSLFREEVTQCWIDRKFFVC